MKNLVESPLYHKTKICLSIDSKMLELIKEIAKLTNSNSTAVIDSLIKSGLRPLTNEFTTSWVGLLDETKDEKKKELLNGLLKKLQDLMAREDFKHLL